MIVEDNYFLLIKGEIFEVRHGGNEPCALCEIKGLCNTDTTVLIKCGCAFLDGPFYLKRLWKKKN